MMRFILRPLQGHVPAPKYEIFFGQRFDVGVDIRTKLPL